MIEKKATNISAKKESRKKKDNTEWKKRGDNKFTVYEGTFILQEFLKKNTDTNHRISLEDIMATKNLPEMGDVGAIKNKLADLTRATYFINRNVPGCRVPNHGDKDDLMHNARVIFEDTDYVIEGEKTRVINGKEKVVFAKDSGTRKRRYPLGTKFAQIYYNHPFSDSEMDDIISSIRQNRTLTVTETDNLIEKLKAELASKHYKTSDKVYKFQEATMMNNEHTRKNILIIDKAIKDGFQINFDFYGYNVRGEKEYVNLCKYSLSPYYIFATGNHYYLIACSRSYRKMMFWRVDLMDNIEILEDKKSIPIEEIPDIPNEWDPELQFKHINMSYDRPERVRLRIKLYNEETGKKISCTYLTDTFGRNFKEIKLDKNHKDYRSGYAVVEVEASPHGLVNWALQFSELVEVLPPIYEGDFDVRGEVIRKLKNMNEKYEITQEE